LVCFVRRRWIGRCRVVATIELHHSDRLKIK
jgi:hypothetical protein